MKSFSLFIDESGMSNPKANRQGCYILCGCLINEHLRETLKIKADQIKFKFWDKTNIVFHSREIWRKEGDFSNLKDIKINNKFQKMLIELLSRGEYQIFAVVVNNEEAVKLNWDERKVYKDTSDIMVRNFILSLLALKARGRLVIESASSEKDFYFHKAASHYLAKGIPELNVSYTEVQNSLTEISFVSKKNFDIEEQISDLLAYAVKLKFQGKSKSTLTKYENQILKVFLNKLFTVHPQTGNKKKKYYSNVESYKMLP